MTAIKKRIAAFFLVLLLMVGIALGSASFFDFVSRTIYEESVAHLTEIFHQANQALYSLVSVNWSRMRMWAPYLKEAKSEGEIVAYLNQAREESNFTNFYFISRDGKYITISGEEGYLDLGRQLSELILKRQPVVVNSVVPDRPEIMVFAIPAAQNTYRGFLYEAVAISYNNTDMVEALKISAFGGKASTFAVLPDGRVVVNNGSEDMSSVHNILAMLDKSGDFSGSDREALRQDFLAGVSGNMEVELGGRSYYLVYEPANFQNWTVVGIVPTDVVNASMNKLQSTTTLVVGGIVVVLAVMILVFVVLQNRQKLKQKDNALLARDELFSKLSVNVDDVFLMMDAEDLRVEYVSPNIEKLVGISERQVLRDIHEIEHLIRADETVHILDQLAGIQPGEQREWDRVYFHQKTGKELWFRVVVFCTDIQGEKKYILDLSDRTKDKKIHQKLESAVRTAENANRAKTAFLNNMSHDIRTPMNAIIGFTNIAMKMEPKPEVKDCLEKIRESSDHLLTLINDVLDISRIESGKVQLLPAPVDITELAKTVVSITQGFLSGRNITFCTSLAAPDHPYVLADAVHIREVLVNILGNAVKFTGDGGSITFETGYLPGPDDRHITARYRVADTGVGMSEDFVTHIFDEFTQEESNARTHYKGTGLGMAISKKFVDLMGGTITVESRKGVGSTVTVQLPLELTEENAIRKQAQAVARADLTGVRILLAEDNDLNAEIAMAQLDELGIRTTRAVDGRDAVDLFAENPPGTFDLILMDIMMPKMNGYEATAAIRGLSERPDAGIIPIIAMTANAFAEDVQASLDAGMNGHIAKPIVMDEVLKTIIENINR